MNKLSFLLFLSIISFYSCTEEEPVADFSAISTTKTNEHVRIDGTKAFAVLPEGFVYKEAMSRYQKKKNLYFQIMEI